MRVHEVMVRAGKLRMPNEILGLGATGVLKFERLDGCVYNTAMYHKALEGVTVYFTEVEDEACALLERLGLPTYDYIAVDEDGVLFVHDDWIEEVEEAEAPSEDKMRQLAEMMAKMASIAETPVETVEEAMKEFVKQEEQNDD